MSSWNGIEDEDANSQYPLSPSPPSSLFSAVFRTPRPPGIQTGEQDSKELNDNRRKITLRYAVKVFNTGSSKKKRIYCDCAGDCRSARCIYYKNGTRYTIYCYRRLGECLNKATGSLYTQIAVVEQDELDAQKNEGDKIKE
jgi:hypothetical protein